MHAGAIAKKGGGREGGDRLTAGDSSEQGLPIDGMAPPPARTTRRTCADNRRFPHRCTNPSCDVCYAADLAVFSGSLISTLRTFDASCTPSGTLTSSTPFANVALTSSSFTPSGSGTER